MGFSENAAKRGLKACNQSVEMAVGWLFDHASDPDINDPLEQPKNNK